MGMRNKMEFSAVVVDDDKNTVLVFCDLLEGIGVKILGRGYDGKEAVELYNKHNPDVIFVDIMMPKYDGFYALEKIKQFNPKAKVIAVTADMDINTQKKLEELKISTIIYKPFDISEIIKMVKN